MANAKHQDSGIKKIEKKRDDLEYLAENAEHVDDVAKALIEVADE